MDQRNDSEGSASIWINRLPAIWGGGDRASFELVIDRKYRGLILPDNVVHVRVHPGKHSIRIRNSPYYASCRINVAQGDEARLFCRPFVSVFEYAIRLWRDDLAENLPSSHDLPSVHRLKIGEPASQTIELIETYTTEEQIGVEHRAIENPSRGTTITRTIRVSREWSKKWSFSLEEARKQGGKLALGAPKIASVGASVERALKDNYGIEETTSEKYSEEFTVNVSPESKIRLTLNWKRVWQHGVARTAGLEVPFEVVRAITFDQSIDDT